MNTPIISVAYHSGFGHTDLLAAAVGEGAQSAGAEVRLVPVAELDERAWEALDGADAIIFGSPTYMGGPSAVFQGFAERTSGRWAAQSWQDKLAAGFTNSGCKYGDKANTLTAFMTLAAQHGMTWVNLGLKPGWNTVGGGEHELNRLGFSAGAGAQTPVDGGPETVHKSDLETCRHLGARVARVAWSVA